MLKQCKGKTKEGKRCSRKCFDKDHCRQHNSSILTKDYTYDAKRGRLTNVKIRKVHHDKLTGLPLRYSRGLTPKERIAYKKEISRTLGIYRKTGKVVGRSRESFRSKNSKETHKRSSHAVKFEKCYGFKVTELSKVKKLFPDTDVKEILAKGRAAYSSGSRPNQYGRGGIEAWSYGRLSSVLSNGKALLVDKDLVGPKSLKVIMSKCR
jgi:hypothetical protein